MKLKMRNHFYSSLFALVVLFGTQGCSRTQNPLFVGTSLQEATWQDYGGAERNEFVPLVDHQRNCRRVTDSTPSLGGIYLNQFFETRPGTEYEISFRIKVLQGTAQFQVVENIKGKMVHHSFGDLTENKWRQKAVTFAPKQKSKKTQFTFINSTAEVPVDFFLCDVVVRSVPLWQRRFASDNMK